MQVLKIIASLLLIKNPVKDVIRDERIQLSCSLTGDAV